MLRDSANPLPKYPDALSILWSRKDSLPEKKSETQVLAPTLVTNFLCDFEQVTAFSLILDPQSAQWGLGATVSPMPYHSQPRHAMLMSTNPLICGWIHPCNGGLLSWKGVRNPKLWSAWGTGHNQRASLVRVASWFSQRHESRRPQKGEDLFASQDASNGGEKG